MYFITELSVSYHCKWQCFFTEETKQAKGAAALSSVFSQLMLGKTIRPDFNIEEKASVEKDKREIKKIIHEMAEYLPQEDPDKGSII